MPAPSQRQIKANIEAALIAKGFTEKEIKEDGSTVDTGRLHPDQAKFVEAISEGIHNSWTQWQAAQIVSVPGVQLGAATAVGTLTP